MAAGLSVIVPAYNAGATLGECVRAPCLARIRDANPVPRSRDPRFYARWVAEHPPEVPVEEVCARWEGRNSPAGVADVDPAVDDGEVPEGQR